MLVNMKDILSETRKNHFTVPAFNISDYAMFNGVMAACEELQSPVILEIHPDELSHIGVEVVKGLIEKANKTRLPVCIHLDHGSTFEQAIAAIQAGFTSVMLDGSSLPFAENIALCSKVVKAAHAVNVSVEGELGTIGAMDDHGEAGTENITYTDPEDVVKFVAATDVDCLAVAIGTAHGLYPKGKQPKLRLDLLREIRAKTEVPLVLHGGSNNPDAEISEAVEIGVSKINISSDIKAAYYQEMRRVLTDLDVREPNRVQPRCIAALKEVACQKIRLFKADGKASCYY